MGDLFLADVSTQIQSKNITTDVTVDTSSSVSHFIVLGECYLLLLETLHCTICYLMELFPKACF